MKVAVKSIENKEVGQIELDDSVFAVEVREDILHRMVHYQLNKRRAGTHKVKDVAEISGSGKKPWKQKGTGRARFGNMRGTQFRGGQTVHGPVVRSHATDLPKKVRQLALKCALSAKVKEGKLVVLDDAVAASHKTKAMASALTALGIRSALIVSGSEVDANFARATRNIPLIDLLPSEGANVYDILRRDTLILTKQAVSDITARLNGDSTEKAGKEKASKAAPAKAEGETKAKKAPAKKAAAKADK